MTAFTVHIISLILIQEMTSVTPRGDNSGVILVRCASQYFETTPIIYLAFEKQPIHILDFTESWLIHILSFELIYPFIRKICAYTWVSENLGHSYTNIRKWGHSYTFFLKKGFITYMKHWAISHAHPYYVIYR